MLSAKMACSIQRQVVVKEVAENERQARYFQWTIKRDGEGEGDAVSPRDDF